MRIVKPTKTAWLVAAVILICSANAFSASQDTFSDTGSRKVTALRIEGKIVIDGQFDEPEWSLARPAADFIQNTTGLGVKLYCIERTIRL